MCLKWWELLRKLNQKLSILEIDLGMKNSRKTKEKKQQNWSVWTVPVCWGLAEWPDGSREVCGHVRRRADGLRVLRAWRSAKCAAPHERKIRGSMPLVCWKAKKGQGHWCPPSKIATVAIYLTENLASASIKLTRKQKGKERKEEKSLELERKVREKFLVLMLHC